MSKEIREFEAAFSPPKNPAVEALRTRLQQLSFFEVRAEEARVGAPVINLIRTSLTKPMQRPIKPGEDGLLSGFHEMAHLRTLGWLLCDTAYVEFAQGRGASGYEHLATSLNLGDAISRFGTMSLLGGSSISTRTLASFDQHIERLTLADLQQIPSLCRSLLKGNRLAESYAYEERLQMPHIEELAKEILTAKPTEEEIPDPTFRALYEQIRKMTPAQRTSFTNEYKARVHARYVALQQELQGLESSWIPEKDVEISEDYVPSSLSDVLDMLAAWTLPARRTVAISYVRYRTQVRLLELHSRVLAFRWRNNRLPTRLAELGLNEAALLDPLSKEPFAYEPSERTYRLYSKGIPETGEVELRYMRPKNVPDSDKP